MLKPSSHLIALKCEAGQSRAPGNWALPAWAFSQGSRTVLKGPRRDVIKRLKMKKKKKKKREPVFIQGLLWTKPWALYLTFNPIFLLTSIVTDTL